ncbi:PREDICTED: probable disease resistance protein At5g63020 [Camelina sativa]|uniref:Probable disease resistance protein At5g63020 n=1 Tax=Camelina sativa TaxID=90675 RepID=A0ABM0VP65_CAMSA|nr:PREDICTED: probable disease resistance protein At5g63020 [Camelina sativa]
MDVRSLGADEAWDLFCERIGKVTLESHPDIPVLARLLVERCRGSSLALGVIGVTMTGKTLVQEWRYAIDALTLSAAKFSGMEDEILPVLKFSYDSLKDERVKQCFQYCALFPKDDIISKQDLVEYWIDEGIIDGKEDRYRAEEEGYEIIGYLVHACLLTEHKFPHSVTMPTLVRDMALWVASNLGEEKENFIVKAKAKLDDLPNVKDWTGVTRMSLSGNRIKNISCSPDCPKLTTLFLHFNDLDKISSGFFMFMPNLMVLDLTGNIGLDELPEEISRLVSLQYLNLSHTNIKELPRGLKELRKLVHLNLEFTGWLKGIAGISSLSNLQVLKLYGTCFYLDIKLVEELQLLKHLKVLTVSVGDAYVWERFMSITRLASCTRGVTLRHCEAGADGISIAATSSRLSVLEIYESNIREIKIAKNVDDESKNSPRSTLSNTWNFQHLVNVEICKCQGLRELTWLLFAPSLVWLKVKESPQIKEIISKDKAASFMNVEAYEIIIPFLRLRHLELENLEELDSIYWSPLSFPLLMKIDVFGCPKLWKLPLSSCSASGSNLVIYGEEEWIQNIQWDEEDTKERFTLKIIKSKVPAEHSHNQSELELRKRVAYLEEENLTIKLRLEKIEMLLWEQRGEQQQYMPPQGLNMQTVVHQQQTGSQSHVPGMQLLLQQQQQPNLIQDDVQNRLQEYSGMLLPQNVIHEQRHSKRTHPEMPSTSRDSSGTVNGDDWQEKVFQKITSMKEVYLPDMTEINHRVSAKLQNGFLPHQERSDEFEKLKLFKTMIERMIRFLTVPKSDIMPALKDKVDYYEKQLINFLNMHRPRVAAALQQGQLLAQTQTNARLNKKPKKKNSNNVEK